MSNTPQILTDDQKQLEAQQLKYSPNPGLLASPNLWNNSYISPAWNSEQKGKGTGINDNYNERSNQFNSSLTQPLGHTQPQIGGQTGGMFGQNHPYEYNEFVPQIIAQRNTLNKLQNALKQTGSGRKKINKRK